MMVDGMEMRIGIGDPDTLIIVHEFIRRMEYERQRIIQWNNRRRVDNEENNNF